jgi:signal peptidase II
MMMMTSPPLAGRGRSPVYRRAWLLAVAALLAGLDLAIKSWAETALATRSISGGVIDLQLGFNRGVAFGLGDNLPSWVVITVTGMITCVLLIVSWWFAPTASRLQLIGLCAVLGGAIANLLDRTWNGHVTDYLHTGWWPTFNLADVCIVSGGILLAASSLWASPTDKNDASVPERLAT